VPLRIVKRGIDVKGKAASVFGIEGPHGFKGYEGLVGDDFHVEVFNGIDEPSILHWHGLTPPVQMDGVPHLPRPPLAPGQSSVIKFQNFTAGTHWMHSHVGLQEQSMLAAPLIIKETAEPVVEEMEHVVMLHDFTFRDPNEILAELKSGGGQHAHHLAGHGASSLNDVVYDAYLANDRTLADPEVVRAGEGGRLRLRIINACAASNMWIDTDFLDAELIAVDGHTIAPVAGRRFPLAIAQRADLRITLPRAGGAFPIFFQAEGVAQRTGIILASPGASVTRVSEESDMAPAVDLSFEGKLQAVAVLREEPVSRHEIVELTGGGPDYMWGLNGKSGMHDTVFTVRQGERIEVTLNNVTQMAHPMHLHGHYFRVVALNGRRFLGALRDTILVPPSETVTIMFDAENPGTWAFHCHHVYHMNSGMMGTISYASPA
jgi:FtsP/CotA-like multicopper oxidase with cupredoxin domain